MSPKRRIMLATLLLAIALTLLWANRCTVLRAAGRWLDVGRRPQRADYVMVLNGGEQTRPFAAAALIEAGLARRALVAEVVQHPAAAELGLPPCHQINRRVLLHYGVADRDIVVLPGAAATTHDEAKALAGFLENRPEARVLIVTSDIHTRRSRWAFAGVLGDRAGQISFVAAPTDQFQMDCWWRDEMGFMAVPAEYLKLAFYVIRYGYVGYWLAACCVLALVAAFCNGCVRDSPSCRVRP